jgi:hypothetical protein
VREKEARMEEKAKINYLTIVFLLILTTFSIYFVLANHVVTISDGRSSFNPTEDVSYRFNISINNNDTLSTLNITRVNITMPGSFIFDVSTNGTNALQVLFTNSSVSNTILNWQNGSGIIINLTTNSFWFNVTPSTPGTFIINVTTQNLTSIINNSITVVINDTTNPLATLGTNPLDNFNSSSRSVIFDLKCTDNYNATSLQLWGNFTGSWRVNQTNSTPVNNVYWNVTVVGIPEGNYVWGAYCVDSAGNYNQTSNRTLGVDASVPIVNVMSPYINGTAYYLNQLVVLNFTVSDISPLLKIWWTNDSGVINTTALSINFTTAGIRNITFYANDSMGNLAIVPRSVIVIALPSASSIANNTVYNISPSTNNVIIPYNLTLVNVTLTNTSQIVLVNYSQQLNNSQVTVVGDASFLTGEGTGIYGLGFYDGTVITGVAGWDGSFKMPYKNLTTFTAPDSGTTEVVVEMGSGGELTLSTPVLIYLHDMEGKHAAWTSGNTTLIDIPTKCNSLILPTNIDPVTTRECYIDASTGTTTGLLISTYHLSSFAAYTPYSAPSSSSSSSSSSGGGSSTSEWTATYSVSDLQFATGYTRGLLAKNRLMYKINGSIHYVGIVSLADTTAVISVSSTPQQATLAIGDTRKFDVTDDGYYDIAVNLVNITNKMASVNVKALSEKITQETTTQEQQKETTAQQQAGNGTTTPVTPGNSGGIKWWQILIIVLVVISIIVWYFASKKKRR